MEVELSVHVVLILLRERGEAGEGLTDRGLVGGREEVEGEEFGVLDAGEEVSKDVEEDDVAIFEDPDVL